MEKSQNAKDSELSENKKKGKMAETLFSKFLNVLKIPFYFIAQSKEHFSHEFFSKHIHRPDYVIHTKRNIFFIDVKYRTKRTISKKNEDRFYLNKDEFDGLYNFHDVFNLSVWIAFTDSSKPKRFYYVSIEELHEYVNKTYEEVNKKNPEIYREKFDVCYILIPEVLLYDYLSFNDGFYKKPNADFYKIEAEYHIEEAKAIRDPEAVRRAKK